MLALLKDVRAVALEPNNILSNAVISSHEKGGLEKFDLGLANPKMKS